MTTVNAKVGDVLSQVKTALAAEAKAAAGNTLLSKAEQEGLGEGVLADAADAIRAAGGPGTKVNVDALVEKATADMATLIASVNQASGSGAGLLSKAEIQALANKNADAGVRAAKAYELITGKQIHITTPHVEPDPLPPPAPGAPQVFAPSTPADVEQGTRMHLAIRDGLAASAFTFDEASLPIGPRLLSYGARYSDSRDGGSQYHVYMIDDGRPLEDLTGYWIEKRSNNGTTTFAGPLEMPAYVDPNADGRLTYPNRARTFLFDLLMDEVLKLDQGTPPSSIALVRGTKAYSVEPWFVVPKNTDGTLGDPDTATQIYFRDPAKNKWSKVYDLPTT